jgi:hypothetical protein
MGILRSSACCGCWIKQRATELAARRAKEIHEWFNNIASTLFAPRRLTPTPEQ